MAQIKKKLNDKLLGLSVEEINFDCALQFLNKSNKQYADILAEWHPDDEYKFFRARYQYGNKIIVNGSLQLPLSDGATVDISDALVPVELKQELGYASMPTGFILNNTVEVFSEIDDQIISLAIFEAGIPLGLLETLDSKYSYCFRNVWNATAGARTAFMVPKISDKIQHAKIQRALGCEIAAPRTHGGHFDVFVEIMNKTGDQKEWTVDILFLSKKWFEPNYNNLHWLNFYCLLQKCLLGYMGFSRNKLSFDLTWHQFLKHLNNKKKRVNLAVFELMRKLIISSLSVAPSFSVAIDNSRAPVDAIQKIYLEHYGLEYSPTIMVPVHFGFSKDVQPVYFSPRYHHTSETSPKNKLTDSLISDLQQLNSLLKDFIELLEARKLKVEDTLFETIVRSTDFNFFHINATEYRNIKNTEMLPTYDPSLEKQFINGKKLPFAYSSNYFRSCVQMHRKNDIKIDRVVEAIS